MGKMEIEPVEMIELGASGLQASPLGIGANRWGSYGKPDPELRDTFEAALDLGINLFDTAEIYSLGGSERTLAELLPEAARKAVITTKYATFPWRSARNGLVPALKASLARLNLPRVDLYLIHWPLPPVRIAAWMEAMAEAVESGLTLAAGVSNFSSDQMRQAHAALAKHNIALACNQVDYSLLNRQPERSGLLQLCRELNVTLVAYRPVHGGLLTGKYTPENLPEGRSGWMVGRGTMFRIQPVVDLLRHMGEAHGGKTPAQVALNWLICKGTLPIPGAHSVKHVQENAGALGWRLMDEEIAHLDSAEEKIHRG
jgi:aryl-alcohol dehydrogenase-like predicted oxidoreductase